ncbi:MAG: MoxR family ATPase [bacterium]
MEPQRAAELVSRVLANIERVIIGKRETIRLALAAVFAGGHILMEDVPGVGKTILCRALARSFSCTFRRLQFTPDLLPTDVTGLSVFNQQNQSFEFRPGPLFSQFLLADEINRATPKTQSALLEAMGEQQVSIDGITYSLPQPFLVLATENPIEYEGTFPLPEAQIDRFLVRLQMGYPTASEEAQMLERLRCRHPIHALEPVADPQELCEAQQQARLVRVDETVLAYIVALSEATRRHEDIYLGASPRASLALMQTSQAWALGCGRSYVLPDDVKLSAPVVLPHRLILKTEARLRGDNAVRLVEEILQVTPLPLGTEHFSESGNSLSGASSERSP